MNTKDQTTYRIGQVGKLLNLPTYVLRFWEMEFSELKPAKTPSGQRIYSQADVEIVKMISHCRYNEKLTVEGTRSRLKSMTSETENVAKSTDYARYNVKSVLDEIKNGLQEILCDLK